MGVRRRSRTNWRSVLDACSPENGKKAFVASGGSGARSLEGQSMRPWGKSRGHPVLHAHLACPKTSTRCSRHAAQFDEDAVQDAHDPNAIVSLSDAART